MQMLSSNLGVRLLGPVSGYYVFCGFLLFLYYPLDERTLELKPVRVTGLHKAFFAVLLTPGIIYAVYMTFIQFVKMIAELKGMKLG